jgi:hypothetical protein
MGLSNEERIKKFFWSAMWWRRRLQILVEALHGRGQDCRDLKNPTGAKVVEGWVSRLDHIVGRMIVRTNFTGGYWLLGSNEDSFQELCGDQYGLGNYSKPEDGERFSIDRTAEYGSLKHWQTMGFAELARKLSSSKFSQQHHDEMLITGMWWDQFRYVDSLLYPVDRYADGLFADIRDDLVQLLGEMTARRMDIQLDRYAVGSDRSDMATNCMVEQALLCKHKVLMHLLDDAEKQQDPPRNTANATKLSEQARAKWQKRYEALYTGSFDILPLVEQVGTMSLAEVEAFLSARSQQKYAEKRTYQDEQHDKNEKKRHPFSGLTGPMARTEKEIQHILDTTTDGQAYEKAYQERYRVYNTSGGFGDAWAEVLKHYPKAAKLGVKAAYEEQSARLNNARKRRFVGTVPKNRLVQAVKDVRAICKGMGIKAANDMLQGKPWALPDENTRKAVVAAMARYGLVVEWADNK